MVIKAMCNGWVQAALLILVMVMLLASDGCDGNDGMTQEEMKELYPTYRLEEQATPAPAPTAPIPLVPRG